MNSKKEKVYNSPYLPNEKEEAISVNTSLHQGILLRRKNGGSASNSRITISSSKNINNHLRDTSIDDTRFIPLTPLKFETVGNEFSGPSTKRQETYEEIKTERREMRTEKSIEKSHERKIYNDDSADYYKYWKKKAGEYQELNFDLHRINSAVQQENEILKHQVDKMTKRLVRQNEPETKFTPNTQNYDKLDSYYRTKVEQLSKKIEEQEILIKKQDKKIRELSNYISENYQLKSLLDNMEEKISEMKSVGSRENSIDQFSPRNHNKNKFSEFLTVERIEYPKQSTSSNYSFRDKKKSVINLSSPNAKACSSREL